MIYACCDAFRKSKIRGRADLNGIDFLEIEGRAGPDRQRLLFVHFINPLSSPLPLVAENVRLEGGERVRGFKVVLLAIDPVDPHVLRVELDRAGDFSRYTLRLVTSADIDDPPAGFDPRLSEVEFSFKIDCVGKNEFLAEFDCQDTRRSAGEPDPEPDIDYLARDYQGFRRLMLDRMAALVPNWTERNPSDLGVTLVEALAFAADRLTYRQDAIAAEAYLGTARRRVSVRRHARLVDYLMHDGCNARTWVQILVNADVPLLPAGTVVLTRLQGQPARLPTSTDPTLIAGALAVFETMHDARRLRVAHNRLPFHTWGDGRCALSRGATQATLRGDLDGLAAGDVLVLEEVKGPRTGLAEDADPRHRHPVRLTRVRRRVDPLDGAKITDITWGSADALPFPLPISASGIDDISVASGNIVLADHGLHVGAEDLGEVPAPSLLRAPAEAAACCTVATPAMLPARYRPILARGPLTQAAPFDATASAGDALRYAPQDALPALSVTEASGASWSARRDLLGSGAGARVFTVEIDSDDSATLRFGDGVHGLRPSPGVRLSARYRVGNGPSGNIGAGALAHVVTNDSGIDGVRNPLPASGGAAPETIEEVRQNAPDAFKTQARAVTEDDYAAIAEARPEVQRAAATLRWTGSWYAAAISVDRVGGTSLDADLAAAVLADAEELRMAGHDVEVREPVYVPIELEIHACADPAHFRSDVKAALQDAFSDRVARDGRRGFFHPDNFTFGQPLIVSRVYAAAQAVPGVREVEITLLERQAEPGGHALDQGLLEIGPREIVRLDNDPNFAEHGVLRVTVGGGK
jgi:Baseplate J-like protein